MYDVVSRGAFRVSSAVVTKRHSEFSDFVYLNRLARCPSTRDQVSHMTAKELCICLYVFVPGLKAMEAFLRCNMFIQGSIDHDFYLSVRHFSFIVMQSYVLFTITIYSGVNPVDFIAS